MSIISSAFAQETAVGLAEAATATATASTWIYIVGGAGVAIAAFIASISRIEIAFGNAALIVAGAVIASLGAIQNFKISATGVEFTTKSTTIDLTKEVLRVNRSLDEQLSVNTKLANQILELQNRVNLMAVSKSAATSAPTQSSEQAKPPGEFSIWRNSEQFTNFNREFGMSNDIIKQNVFKSSEGLKSLQEKLEMTK